MTLYNVLEMTWSKLKFKQLLDETLKLKQELVG